MPFIAASNKGKTAKEVTLWRSLGVLVVRWSFECHIINIMWCIFWVFWSFVRGYTPLLTRWRCMVTFRRDFSFFHFHFSFLVF